MIALRLCWSRDLKAIENKQEKGKAFLTGKNSFNDEKTEKKKNFEMKATKPRGGKDDMGISHAFAVASLRSCLANPKAIRGLEALSWKKFCFKARWRGLGRRGS